jgi:hypothetical protein
MGHYDTWLVNALHRTVELNHNVLLFPGWSNASNYISTAETFGIVPLASPSMTEAINRVDLPVDFKLPRDLGFLAERSGLVLPTLPWNSTQECKLYPKLLLQSTKTCERRGRGNLLLVESAISIAVLKHMDGVNVFPKLDVYNRIHEKRFQRNTRICDTAKAMEQDLAELARLNSKTTNQQDDFSDNNDPIFHDNTNDFGLPAAKKTSVRFGPYNFAGPIRPVPHINVNGTMIRPPSDVLYAGPILISAPLWNPLLGPEPFPARKVRGRDTTPQQSRCCKQYQRSEANCPGG